MPVTLSVGGVVLATLSDDEFAKLDALLIREHSADEDFYITGATLDYLRGKGVASAVIDALATALPTTGGSYRGRPGASDAGIDVIWRRRD